MSNSAIANINQPTFLFSAGTTVAVSSIGTWQEKCIIYNKGTVPIYVRSHNAATPSGQLNTVPVNGSTGNWSEVPPGIPMSYSWSVTMGGPTAVGHFYLEYIASAAADFSIKMSNGV